MKRIMLHLEMLALLLPCLLMFSCKVRFDKLNVGIMLSFLGVCYFGLLLVLSGTDAGKRFLRRYYHEIMRLENSL